MNFIFSVGVVSSMITIVVSENSNQMTMELDLTNFDSENPPTSPVEITTKNISNAKSFCVRYYVASVKNQGIFTTPKSKIGFTIYTNQNLGFIRLNDLPLVFPLRNKKPYEYEHICFTHNETSYIVASEGSILYSSKFQEEIESELNKPFDDTKIIIGPLSFKTTADVQYFKGKISELNLFSNSFSELQLKKMSGSCMKIMEGEKVFDWSQIKSSDVSIPYGYSITLESDNIEDVCSTKQRDQIALLPFPLTIEGMIYFSNVAVFLCFLKRIMP